jgi:hypothetical protein
MKTGGVLFLDNKIHRHANPYLVAENIAPFFAPSFTAGSCIAFEITI